MKFLRLRGVCRVFPGYKPRLYQLAFAAITGIKKIFLLATIYGFA